MVAHRKNNEKLEETHKATGGPLGGENVTTEIHKYLTGLFGFESVALKEKSLCDYLEFLLEVEIKRRMVSQKNDTFVTLRLPYAILDMADMDTFKRRVSDFGGKVIGNKLRLKSSFIVEIYDAFVKDIISAIHTVLQNPKTGHVKAVYLVGGCADSCVLQESFRSAFPNIRVIVPENPDLAVVQGAVLFGHNQSIISKRILRYTYGIRTVSLDAKPTELAEKALPHSHQKSTDKEKGKLHQRKKQYVSVDPSFLKHPHQRKEKKSDESWKVETRRISSQESDLENNKCATTKISNGELKVIASADESVSIIHHTVMLDVRKENICTKDLLVYDEPFSSLSDKTECICRGKINVKTNGQEPFVKFDLLLGDTKIEAETSDEDRSCLDISIDFLSKGTG